MRSNTETSLARAVVACACAATLLASVAAAQNNSLFGSAQPAQQPGASRAPAAHAPSQVAVPMVVPQAVVAARTATPPPPENVRNPSLLAVSPIAVAAPEPKKFKVHDLVTIIVRQTKETASDANMKSEKDWKLEAELSKWIRLSNAHGIVPAELPAGNPAVDFSFANEYEGKGKQGRKDSLTTRITAEIIDVKPNGNLVIEATSRIKIDEGEQIMTLTGTCRSDDVTAQNTVLSTQLAQLTIESENTGAIRDATRRGWLMRAFDLLRPL